VGGRRKRGGTSRHLVGGLPDKNVTDAFDELLTQRRWETTTDGAGAPAEPSLETDGVDEPAVEDEPAAAPEEVTSSEPAAADPEPLPPARPLSSTKQREIARCAARAARWQQVHERHVHGDSIRSIAETLHLHRRTVRRLLDSPQPPRNHRYASCRANGVRRGSPARSSHRAVRAGRTRQRCGAACGRSRRRGRADVAPGRGPARPAVAGWPPH